MEPDGGCLQINDYYYFSSYPGSDKASAVSQVQGWAVGMQD